MTIDTPSATNSNINNLPSDSPEETFETKLKSSPNPLGGGGVVFEESTAEDLYKQLSQAFGLGAGKPVLPNPPDLSALESYSQVSKETLAHIQRLKDSGVWDGYADLSKLDGDGLALLCMLFTQQSKAELIKGLKAALAAKVQERASVQNEYLAQQKEVLDEQIEMQKAYETQKKAAEEAAKAKSIFGIIGAIIGAVVAVVAAVACPNPLTIAAATFAVAGACCSVAASACTLAAMDNPELAEKLAPHIKNLGIASAVLGLAAAICSVGSVANAATTISSFAKAVQIGGAVVSGLCTIAGGITDVVIGSKQLELAEKQKELDEQKIKLEKLDSDVEFLQKLIDALMKSVEEFLDLFLNAEQTAAQEMTRMADAQLAITDEIPRTA
ncbi:MAG: hypothetical protein LBB19_00055 [Puniceicoccales bacterium]|jgi:hypothetical protein|nr:hypothetical protein [Puniceicoccales bacterium]